MTKKSQEKKKKTEENLIDPENYEHVVVPPDGGFGWVIAIAAMLCNLVCDGTLFAFGTMKIHIQKHFQCSDMLILMVGSVPCGVYLLVGPIVSGLANRYGCRIIIIIGSIGAAVTMVLSTFSPNVWAMMVIYGVVGGIFFGMIYLPSVVMVSFYFDKKRSIANGIVTAGTGIGVLSFGPLANYLMTNLGWKVGMYIFAGIMLSCILFGAIMIPLKAKRIPIKRPAESVHSTVDTKPNPIIASTQETNPGDTHEPLLTGSKETSGTEGVEQSLSHCDDHRVGVVNPDNATRPFFRKDVLFTGSKQDLHRISRTSLHSNPYMATAVVDKDRKQSAAKAFADILAAMTDFSILKNKKMLLICIGNIFSMLGYYLPIMCLVSFAIDDMNVSPTKASFLMTIFGLFNTIGRFVGGPIAMLPHLNPLIVHNAMLYLTGLLTVGAAYAYNFTTAALYAGFCGFAVAPHMSLMPSVVLDCVGLDKFTNAFGILFLFRGATSIIGPPVAGFLKDYTKRYDIAFIVGGAMIIIAAFFHFAVAFVPGAKAEEEKKKDEKPAHA